jgi:hypothetical protein
MIRVVLLNFMTFALLSFAVADDTSPLSRSVIQFESQRDLKWKTDIYDKIKGNTHAEKA